MVAAVLVELERHDRHPGAGKGALSYATQLLSTSQPIRAPRCRAAVLPAMQGLQDAAALVRARGHTIEVLTGGGTGSVRFDLDLEILPELQPGSYVFMDASYRKLGWDEQGSPPPFGPALSVLTRVISKPASDRVVVDAGWKAASCD